MDPSTTDEPVVPDSDSQHSSPQVTPQHLPHPRPSLQHSPELGEGSLKLIIAVRVILAVLGNLVCFVLALLVIIPSVGLSWKLGFRKQLVVIGALLGVENFCFQTVLPHPLLLLEARLGKPAIQIYNAGLRKRFGGDYVDWTRRAGLLVFRMLPIVLGIAYKQFLGGASSSSVPNNEFSGAMYGLAYPDLGQYASLENSIFLSLNANSAFLNASRYDQDYPHDVEFPQAYGYNTLVLSQNSAALLDLPEAAYVREIQGKLTGNETWRVSASVDAIVATRNESIDSLRNDTQFLTQTINEAYNNFASQYLFQPGTDLGFGWASVGNHDVGDAYCLMGPVSNFSAPPSYPIGFVDSITDVGFLSFMESAQMFSIRRQACQANWMITNSEVKLLDGSCFNDSSSSQAPNSSFLHDGQTSPFALDILPVLVNTVGPYSYSRPNSAWKQISYVVAAANAWWARSAFLNFGGSEPGSLANKYPEILYSPRDQSLVSSRSTLRAASGLYAVMAVFPVVTLLSFLTLLCLYYLPIGRGFGLVWTLAGVHSESLHAAVQQGGAGGRGQAINLEQLQQWQPSHPVRLEAATNKQVADNVRETTGGR